jgi:hypothetical protein
MRKRAHGTTGKTMSDSMHGSSVVRDRRNGGFPSRVVIDDKCDCCGPQAVGRLAVSWGYRKPVVCVECLKAGQTSLVLRACPNHHWVMLAPDEGCAICANST